MATHFTADPINKLIIITTPPTLGELTLDVRRDIYSALKVDWLTDDELNKYRFPIRVSGGDPISNTLASGGYYYLQYGWRIRPYESTHRFILDGNIFVDGGVGRVDVPTLGSFQVNVNVFNSALVYQTTSGDIANAVWDAQRSGHAVVNSFGEKVGRRASFADEGDGIIRESD